jgi:DhnA family fructose-bisphosphate aldolase class Ia
MDSVAGALSGGAAGLAIGRRVWQAADPSRLLGVLRDLVHSQITVAEAMDAV